MDTKFAVAVHALVFISESTDSKTSETISKTLNTNAVNVNINLYKKWKIIMYKFNGSSLLPCE